MRSECEDVSVWYYFRIGFLDGGFGCVEGFKVMDFDILYGSFFCVVFC